MAARPNFVVVVADQLRADDLPLFSPEAPTRTPNLQRMARAGVAFSEVFGQHSVCSPSRVSYLSGLYPHVRGNRTLEHLIEPHEPNFLKDFKQGGYHVAVAGMRGDSFAPGATEVSAHQHGFLPQETRSAFTEFMHRRQPSNEPMARAHYRGLRSAEQGQTDFDETTVRAAEHWLQRPPAQPWLLYVPLIFPHPPFAVEEPWFSLYDRARMAPPRRATGAQPRYVQALRELHGWDRLQAADWAEIRAVYLGMVSRLDAHLGRLLDAAETDPGSNNHTVFVFFSDHGEYLGDYGLVEKWPSGLHECLTRIPLVLSGKGLAAPSATSTALVELLDVFPTLLDLAGITPAHQHFGRSFKACLARPGLPHRHRVFSEGGFTVEEERFLEHAPFPYDLKAALQHRDPQSVGKAVCLRDAQWTYVWRLYEPAELYDRKHDPHELVNLAGQPELAPVQAAMQEQVLRWMVQTADVLREKSPSRFSAVNLPGLGRAPPGTSMKDTA
jgi:arylsulfatase A-like enzyme